MKQYRVTEYHSKKRPNLKFVVRSKVSGKWERKFFGTKADAKTYVQLKETELLNQGKEGATFPSWLRVMAQRENDRLQPFEKTITDAVEFYLPHLQAMNRSCTFRALKDELLKAKLEDGASARYIQDLRSRLGQFAKEHGDKTVAAITAQEVDGWLRALNVSALTRNNFRRVLIVAFNFAGKRGYCITNPAKKADKAKEIEGKVGILTVAETARLLRVSPATLRPFVAIGAFAGLRRAELERLEWPEVDLRGGLIQVTAKKAKSARRRFVKIRPNLAAWLQSLARRKGLVTPTDYRELFDTARIKAGIIDWPNNALRHGFASYSLAREGDAARLALELGHTDANLVFTHYRELVRPTDAAKYWRIRPKNPR